MDGGRMALDNKTSLLNTPLLTSSPRVGHDHFYDPPLKQNLKDISLDESGQLTDGTPWSETSPTSYLSKEKFVILYFLLETESGLDQSERVAELLKELSNHNERVEERKAALYELLKLIRENTLQVWDEHFKTILLLLLETMGDREVQTLAERLFSS